MVLTQYFNMHAPSSKDWMDMIAVPVGGFVRSYLLVAV